jgi:hypothetical protein
MTQFHIENVTGPWVSLVEEYPHIYREPSPEVYEMWQKYGKSGDMPRNADDLCNLRYGFECPDEAYPLVKMFSEEIDALMKKSKSNGHDFKYWSFILKTKFGTLRDQGDTGGADRDIYHNEYREISERLYSRSLDCKALHPRKRYTP